MGRLPRSVATNHCLADLVELQRGYDLTADERLPGLTPVIGGGGPNGTHDVANVTGPGVVVVRSGSGFGNVWWVADDFWAHNTVMFAKSFKGNDELFAYYVLDWLDFTSYNSGGAQPSLNRNFIYAIPILLPPLPEQRKIAEILSTWDAAIGAQERLIANARAQKKALMQSLLTGKYRLPGFDGEWVRKQFRDAVYVDRNSLGQNTPADFRFRYISLSDVATGTIAPDLSELEFATAPSRARRKLSTGDILMATVRPNLQAFARVGSNHAECIASTGFAVLTAKLGFDPSYIYHYLFSEHLTGQIDALVVGSSYPAINSSDIQGLSIHCPSADEQAAIAQVLNASDALITDHENQLSVFRQEKSALMQQLLTGKRRVRVDLEIDV